MNAHKPDVKQHWRPQDAPVGDIQASLEAILEHTSDGIFMVDVPPAGLDAEKTNFRLVAANSAYVRMLWSGNSNIVGLTIQECLPEGLAQTTQLSLVCCMKQGQTISYEASFEIEGRSCTLLTTLSPVWTKDGTMSEIVGVCQDVTERRRVLKEARLLQTLTLAIAESQNFHAALGVALRKVCEVTNWDYGEAWVLGPDLQRLERSPAWYGANKYRQFRRLNEGMTFPVDSGGFGQVWSLHSTEWAPDISQATEQSLLQVQQAIAHGLGAGLAMPLLAGGEVLAVLVFFMVDPSAIDRRLIELVSAITVQLGVVLHHKKYRNIFENSVAGMFQTTSDGRYITVNPMLARILGYDSPEDLMTMVTDIEQDLYVDPNARDEFLRCIEAHDCVCGFETQVYRKDGRIIWISENARAVRDPNGRIVGYEGTVEDITQRKQAEIYLCQRDKLLQSTAKAMHELLTNSDHDAAINTALEILGQTTTVDRVCIYENHPHPEIGELAISLRYEWTNKSVQPKRYKPEWQNLTYQALGAGRWYGLLSKGFSIREITRESPAVERQILERDGILSFLIVPILINDHFWGCVSFEDCHTEREWSESEISILLAIAASIGGVIQHQRTEEMIQYRAFHDLLTGLPNRLLFDEHLQTALARAQRTQEMLAVCFIDLDRFKIINDTLGHAVGDQLLQRTSDRLKTCLRKCDILARWGGDEFILLLPQIRSAQDAAKVAQRLLEALEPAFDIDGQHIYISTSIGIALYPTDSEDSATLMKQADTALYRAKKAGRNNYQLYNPAMNYQASEELILANSLHRALEQDEFLLYYQPQVDTDSGAIIRMEALLRWQHPEFGLVMPQKFITFAEENGLIVPISKWVLRTACLQNKTWQDVGLPSLPVAVNLAGTELQQPDFLLWVAQILNETTLEPRFLELEIKETTAMENVDFTIAILTELQRMGISIAIDDFGTGYASLSYLQKFPIDTLKIAKTFVQSLTPQSNETALVSALVALGKGLNIRVVAEGVETQNQLELLRSLHCQKMQGYLFSQPLCVEEATHFLEKTLLNQKVQIG